MEADETYFGSKDVVTKRTIRGKPSHSSQRSVVALVERGGKVRSFHVENADKATVNTIVQRNIAREARLHTDESKLYGDALEHVAELRAALTKCPSEAAGLSGRGGAKVYRGVAFYGLVHDGLGKAKGCSRWSSTDVSAGGKLPH